MIQSTLLMPTSNFANPLHSPINHSRSSNHNTPNYSSMSSGKLNLCERQTDEKNNKKPLILPSSGLCKCGRRHFLETFPITLLPSFPSLAQDPNSSSGETLNKIRPRRSDWYEELYASVMNYCMKPYEAEVERYKSQLFDKLRGQAKEIVEMGIGTGPNLKYYAGDDGVRVFGVDPNKKMEKYARRAAEAAGLSPANFEFIHAVGEALPLSDASVDAVIGTLVLCSVEDVDTALEEVKRVLKPGGLYLFIEHVAAREGTFRRFVQNILEPLQVLVGDGCHLTRETGKNISEAGFSDVDSSLASISKAFFVNPHLYGIAHK